MVEIFVVIALVLIILCLWRIEQILQSVCRNQVMQAKLLGKAHGIPVYDKKN